MEQTVIGQDCTKHLHSKLKQGDRGSGCQVLVITPIISASQEAQKSGGLQFEASPWGEKKKKRK
jgi:hypothetical protein